MKEIQSGSQKQVFKTKPASRAGFFMCAMHGDKLDGEILSPANLNAAYKRVVQNKGAGGIDEMEVGSLKDYLIEQKEELVTSILAGTYRPNPVRRVLIPQDDGKQRQLGIPTVVDRAPDKFPTFSRITSKGNPLQNY